MKKMILAVFFAHTTDACLSQTAINTRPVTKTGYLQKSKNQKIAAWALLGGGAVVSVIGLTQVNVAGSDNAPVNNTPGLILLVSGLTASLTSIPFFISSQKNKAMSLQLETQSFLRLKSSGLNTALYPAVSLKVTF
ncbi:MAG: hypothetical protein J0L54_02920 [Chitinophagales bacterium]|nr:hypothetical protein [Chitinophagales bacterium]